MKLRKQAKAETPTLGWSPIAAGQHQELDMVVSEPANMIGPVVVVLQRALNAPRSGRATSEF